MGGLAITVSVSVSVQVNTPPVPPESLGWAGPEAVEAASPIVEAMPEFQIVGAVEDNSGKNVRLWEFTKRINGGKHTPNYPQQVGDCVSFGGKNVLEYLQARQICVNTPFHVMDGVTRGPPIEWRPVFPPYLYGYSRVVIGDGRLRGSDGSVGAWLAKGVQQGGVLPSDADGVPEYSGAVARQWGDKGPPDGFVNVAREHLVRTVSQVRSADDVRDAICNGYPCTIASNFGTKTIREQDGRMVARWDGRWMHQMAVVAYDGSGREPYFYILNSWGPSAHPQPLQGEPPGGFWVTAKTMDGICKQGDSFAFSEMDGFPSNEMDFNVIGSNGASETESITAAKSEIVMFVEQVTTPLWYLLSVCMGGIGLAIWPRKNHCNYSVTSAGVALAVILGLSSLCSAEDEPMFRIMGDTTVATGPAFLVMGGPSDSVDSTFVVMGEDPGDRWLTRAEIVTATNAYWADHKTMWLTSIPQTERELLGVLRGSYGYRESQLSGHGLRALQWVYAATEAGVVTPHRVSPEIVKSTSTVAVEPRSAGRWIQRQTCRGGRCTWEWLLQER